MAPAAFADTLVIPAAQESVEGNEANAFPFGKTAVSNNPYRYQQVYNASGFSGLGEPGDVVTISELRFRTDSTNQVPTTVNVNDIEVHLSTTAVAADGLDNEIFDNNIGPDDTIVFSGTRIFPVPTVTTAPRPFEVTIPITPFTYDPSEGNLLLEVYNFSEFFPLGYTLDLQNTVGDETSRVVEVIVPGTGNHVIPPVGIGSRGLVTQFVYTVPEAGALGTGMTALFALTALRRRTGA